MIQEILQETLKFELDLVPEFWDKPPHVKILLNNEEKFTGFITEKTKIKFNQTLEFNKNHVLKILRSNKTDDQVKFVDNSVKMDQSLLIDKLVIDGINCRSLINDYGYAIFEYPEIYAKEQARSGVKLPFKHPAATLLSFNGVWVFNFSSPFYIFIMKWMGGGIH